MVAGSVFVLPHSDAVDCISLGMNFVIVARISSSMCVSVFFAIMFIGFRMARAVGSYSALGPWSGETLATNKCSSVVAVARWRPFELQLDWCRNCLLHSAAYTFLVKSLCIAFA